jgi:predicted PurR-regulated permease PerM
VLVPIALAILVTFVLAPPVTRLQRWTGRIPAVLAMVRLVFTVFGLAGCGLARQMNHRAEDLPRGTSFLFDVPERMIWLSSVRPS